MRDFVLEDDVFGSLPIKVYDDHDCVFCDHCSDIFWDHSNLIYMIFCEKGNNPWQRPCDDFAETLGGE